MHLLAIKARGETDKRKWGERKGERRDREGEKKERDRGNERGERRIKERTQWKIQETQRKAT
jgi:hypothetical protein